MTYTIYSSGDGAFLAEVLNAVALMMGSDDMVAIAMIGVLLGTVFTIMSSIATGKFSLANPVLAIVMYLVLFTPRVDVVVYDVYSWSGRPVDNVPLGVAAAGMTLSHMGYAVTDLFEDAYTLPGMLDTGYSTPLEMLLSVRGGKLGTANSIAANDNLLQTLSNYVNDCTETGIMLGMKEPASMVENPDVWAAIEFPSAIYTTKVHLGTSGGQMMECSDAYAAIDAKWGDYLNAWDDYIAGRYQVSDASTVIQGALDSMVSMGLSANQYMRNALLSNVLTRVASGNYANDTYQSTIITTQAVEQARVQFAAESSMFARFARPLMTFVESFVYSIVPFMVFIIGFGLAGFKLIGRYVLILLWVQLWMPIMSITNLFISMAFAGSMDSLNTALAASGSPLNPLSLLGMQAMQSEAADWVAVGGNLIAAAPALALTVIYGGAYTMVNLANRLSPSDMVDEKQAAPDLLKNGGVMSMSPMNSYDPTMGMRATGTEGVMPTLDLGATASQQLASASARQESAQASYSETISQSIGSALSGGVSASDLEQIGRGVSSSSDTSYGRMMREAESYAEAHSFSADQTSALKGAITASASGSVGISALGNSLMTQLSGQSNTADTLTDKSGTSDELRSMLEEASSREVRESFSETVTRTSQNSEQESWERVAQEQNAESYNDARQRLETANRSYSEAEQFSNSVGMSQKVSVLAMAEQIAGDKEAFDNLSAFMATHDTLGPAMQEQADALMADPDHKLGDPRVEANERQYVAAGALMTLGSNLGDADAREKLMDLAYRSGFVADGMGPDGVDPASNRGVASDVWANTSDVAPAARAATGEAADRLQGAEQRAEEALGKTQREYGDIDEMKASMRERFENRAEATTQLSGQARAAALPEARERLEGAPDISSTAYWGGFLESLSNAVGEDVMRSAFTGDRGEEMTWSEIATEAAKAQSPAYWIYSSLTDSGVSPERFEEINESLSDASAATRTENYQAAQAAGLPDTLAATYADAASMAHTDSIRNALGQGVPDLRAAFDQRDDLSTSDGYRMQMINDHYGDIYGMYRSEFNMDKESAEEATDLAFERILEAAKAGTEGTKYLGRLSTYNAALGPEQ